MTLKLYEVTCYVQIEADSEEEAMERVAAGLWEEFGRYAGVEEVDLIAMAPGSSGP